MESDSLAAMLSVIIFQNDFRQSYVDRPITFFLPTKLEPFKHCNYTYNLLKYNHEVVGSNYDVEAFNFTNNLNCRLELRYIFLEYAEKKKESEY